MIILVTTIVIWNDHYRVLWQTNTHSRPTQWHRVTPHSRNLLTSLLLNPDWHREACYAHMQVDVIWSMYMNRCGTPDQVWRHVLPGTYWALVNLHFNQGWKLNLIMFIQHLMDFQNLLKKKKNSNRKESKRKGGKRLAAEKTKTESSLIWLIIM